MSFLGFIRTNLPFLTAGILLTLGSSYGQTFFISLFATELKAAHGLTDGGWGLTYTVATAASAVVMLWAGTLTDKFRVRQLAPFVLIGLAAACLMMTQAPGVWWLCLTVFLLRLFGQGMMSQLAIVSMARWFVATRGRALSIASLGFSIGTAFLPMLVAALVLILDWRWIWVAAATISVATIPALAALLRFERTPQSVAEETEAAGVDGRHWTRADLFRSPVFWALVPALLGPSAWGTALGFHQVHLAEMKGWSFLSYVSLYPLSTAIAVLATFASGAAVDRFGSRLLLPYYMLPFGLSFAVMGWAGGIPGAALALGIFGIGQGMQATLGSAFWAEFFGTRHLGSLKAVSLAIMVLGSAIGPGVSGLLIDAGLTFDEQLLWLAGYFIIAAALATMSATLARPRKVDV